MSFGIRSRLFLWLALVIVPVGAATWVALELVEQRLVERIEADLESARSLEATRLSEGLESYRRDATSLASTPGLGDLMTPPGGVSTDAESPARPIRPAALRRLETRADELLERVRSTGGPVVALRLVGRDGRALADAGGFTWTPREPDLVERAIASGRPLFGEAFRVGRAEELGLVAPIFNSSAEIVGTLLLETRLDPLVEPLQRHQGFGDTREAYLVQEEPDGDAQFITPLRFAPDAAFRRVVAAEQDTPVNMALASTAGMVINGRDYRNLDSVLAYEPVEATGWGLVVKVDRAEAYALVQEVRGVVIVSGLVALPILILGWMLVVGPLALRLRRSARAAERVASGDYLTPIADRAGDEIGDLARAIDRLAADLDADIAKRTEVEGRLRHRASHDDLTGLRNRQYTTDVIRALIDADDGEDLSLLFLDLDRFKLINDTFGHAVGDEVLVAAGGRLKGAVSETSTVARWGGDEFVVVLPRCNEPQAAAVVERLRGVFERPIGTSAGLIDVATSIGAATAAPGSSVDSLLLEADACMFTDKELGSRGRPAQGLAPTLVASALEQGRVEAWYQPMVTASDDGELRLFGIEALARIRQPGGELLLPGDFVPGIAATPQAVDLDLRVAANAFRDLGRWRREGRIGTDLRLALNFSAATVASGRTATELRAAADDAGIDLTTVVIELPEDSGDLDPAGLAALRSTGVTLGMDDSGIDYSRLDRLTAQSAQVVKLDRRWLAEHGSQFGERERDVLARLVDLCADLDMQLVAEGVETPAQFRVLLGLGVPHFQGYHFAHPQPAEILEGDWLSRQSSPAER